MIYWDALAWDLGVAAVLGVATYATVRVRRRRRRNPFVSAGAALEDAMKRTEMHIPADANNGLEVFIGRGAPPPFRPDQLQWDAGQEQHHVDGIVDRYLRRANIPFPVGRAGVPEGVAVYDPLKDRCTACHHSLGAPGIYRGIPFTLCDTTPSGKPCGRYRSSLLLTDEVMERQAASTREAMLRLHYDIPTTMSDDPEVRAWYRNRLGHEAGWRKCPICVAPESCAAREQCVEMNHECPMHRRH